MLKILKSICHLGLGSVISIISWIVILKVIAISHGPSGIGLFSILRQTNLTLLSLLSLQGTNAIVQGANVRSGEDRTKYLISSGLVILLSSLLFISIYLAVSPHIIPLSASEIVFNKSLLVRLIAVPAFLGVIYSYFIALLNCDKKIEKIGVSQASASIITVLLAIILINLIRPPWLFLIIISLNPFFGILFSFFFQKNFIFKNLLSSKTKNLVSKKESISFLKFSTISLLAGFTGTSTILLIRLFCAKFGGFEFAGLFDVAWSLSSTYLNIFFTSLGTYYLPTLVSIKDPVEKINLVNTMARIAFLICLPIILIAIIFKSQLVAGLYSTEFQSSVIIIRWFLIGDFFKAISWVLAMPMIAYADLSKYFWSEILGNLFLLTGSWLALFKIRSAEGLGFIYLIFYIGYFIYSFYYIHRRMSFTPILRNLCTFISSIILITLFSYLTWAQTKLSFHILLFAFIGLILFAFFSIKKSEASVLIKIITSRSKKSV